MALFQWRFNFWLTSGRRPVGHGGDQLFHVSGQCALELEILTARGMAKRQRPGVQGLAGKPRDRVPGVRRQRRPPAPAGPAICGITDHRVAAMGEMDTNLVGASGLEAAFEQTGGVADDAAHPVVGHRRPAALGHDRHPFAVQRAAPDIAFDAARGWAGQSPYQGLINSRKASRGELIGQTVVRGVGLGGHHESAGVLVEPVDDAGPHDAANARQAVATVGDKGVDQGRIRISGGGVHDHAGRLVDDDDGGIFKHHVEGDSLSPG